MDTISDFEPVALKGQPNASGIAQLIVRLYERGGEYEPEFDFFLTCVGERIIEVTGSIGSYEGESVLRGVIEEPKASTPNFDDWSASAAEIQFGGFYSLVKYYLADGKIEDAQDVVKEFKKDFGVKPLYKTLKAEVLRRKGGPQNLTEALRIALEVAKQNEDVPESQHLLASVVATILEQEVDVSFENIAGVKSREGLLREARSSINRTIGLEPDYGKYRATYGRILMLEDQFEKARGEFWEAIRLIDHRRPEREKIMAENRIQLWMIDIQIQQREIESEAQDRLDEINEKIDDITSRYEERILQFLAFFAGLIAVAVSATQIVASGETFRESAQLVLVLTGGLLVAFGGFSLVLPKDHDSFKRTVVVILVGFLLSIVGILSTQL